MRGCLSLVSVALSLCLPLSAYWNLLIVLLLHTVRMCVCVLLLLLSCCCCYAIRTRLKKQLSYAASTSAAAVAVAADVAITPAPMPASATPTVKTPTNFQAKRQPPSSSDCQLVSVRLVFGFWLSPPPAMPPTRLSPGCCWTNPLNGAAAMATAVALAAASALKWQT